MLESFRATCMLVTANYQVKIPVHFPQPEPEPIATTDKPPEDSTSNLFSHHYFQLYPSKVSES
jgi:hypothetical protein